MPGERRGQPNCSDRVSAVEAIGFSERQARFLVTVMLHSGVFVGRQYAAFSGISHGSERDKRHHFGQRLGGTLRDDEYPRLVFGQAPNQTIRYFPDKLPVGFERHGYRHVLLYPARSSSPMEFRLFLLRHLELLNTLSHWTIRVLFPRSLASAMDTFEEAAYEHLAKHLQLSAAEELKWFFGQHQRTGQAASGADDARLRAARKEFRAPRFTALRRRWLEDGDRVIWLAASPVSRDTLTRQRANVECVELPHSYDHFSSPGRYGGPQPSRPRGMKLAGGAFPLSDHDDSPGASLLVTT